MYRVGLSGRGDHLSVSYELCLAHNVRHAVLLILPCRSYGNLLASAPSVRCGLGAASSSAGASAGDAGPSSNRATGRTISVRAIVAAVAAAAVTAAATGSTAGGSTSSSGVNTCLTGRTVGRRTSEVIEVHVEARHDRPGSADSSSFAPALSSQDSPPAATRSRHSRCSGCGSGGDGSSYVSSGLNGVLSPRGSAGSGAGTRSVMYGREGLPPLSVFRGSRLSVSGSPASGRSPLSRCGWGHQAGGDQTTTVVAAAAAAAAAAATDAIAAAAVAAAAANNAVAAAAAAAAAADEEAAARRKPLLRSGCVSCPGDGNEAALEVASAALPYRVRRDRAFGIDSASGGGPQEPVAKTTLADSFQKPDGSFSSRGGCEPSACDARLTRVRRAKPSDDGDDGDRGFRSIPYDGRTGGSESSELDGEEEASAEPSLPAAARLPQRPSTAPPLTTVATPCTDTSAPETVAEAPPPPLLGEWHHGSSTAIPPPNDASVSAADANTSTSASNPSGADATESAGEDVHITSCSTFRGSSWKSKAVDAAHHVRRESLTNSSSTTATAALLLPIHASAATAVEGIHAEVSWASESATTTTTTTTTAAAAQINGSTAAAAVAATCTAAAVTTGTAVAAAVAAKRVVSAMLADRQQLHDLQEQLRQLRDSSRHRRDTQVGRMRLQASISRLAATDGGGGGSGGGGGRRGEDVGLPLGLWRRAVTRALDEAALGAGRVADSAATTTTATAVEVGPLVGCSVVEDEEHDE